MALQFAVLGSGAGPDRRQAPFRLGENHTGIGRVVQIAVVATFRRDLITALITALTNRIVRGTLLEKVLDDAKDGGVVVDPFYCVEGVVRVVELRNCSQNLRWQAAAVEMAY